MSIKSTVLIIDYGSSLTLDIARFIRSIGYFSYILPCDANIEKIEEINPKAILLSGDADSIFELSLPFNHSILQLNVPIMAIGYAAVLLGKHFNFNCSNNSNFANNIELKDFDNSSILKNLPNNFSAKSLQKDCIKDLPKDFFSIAKDSYNNCLAYTNSSNNLFGIQFLPEANEHKFLVIENFLSSCTLQANWTIESFIADSVSKLKDEIGTDNVVLALSGGVDSTVVASLLHRAIGEQLHCIFVDTGLMRKNEANDVIELFKTHMPGINLKKIEAKDRFLKFLNNVDDPEEKRKIIGRLFIEIFEEEANKISNVKYLGQGTVYPDVVESYSIKGQAVKSHHNVGGLPEKMNLKLVEPLRYLFKDEVRAIGKSLGLPDAFVWRQPFPGPGLAVRILGSITEERLNTLKEADYVVQREFKLSGWHTKVWQHFAVLIPLRTVGVKNDMRTYGNIIAIRAVTSKDAMTAEWSRIPYELLSTISKKILDEVYDVSRVVYDISDKPPSTIEWE